MLELVPDHTVFPGGVNMNEKTWKALPPEIQKVLLKTKYEFTDYFYHIEKTERTDAAINFCKKKHSFMEVSPADLEKWRVAVKGEVTEKWIKEAKSKAFPFMGSYP